MVGNRLSYGIANISITMKREGQSFLEYALLIGCIAITLFAMQAYLKRGIQGVIKSSSDDLGAPVLDATGRNAQDEGARSWGWNYQLFPTSIDTTQQITTNEYASGDRRFRIDQDSRATTTGYSLTIPPKEYLASDKDNQDPGPVAPGAPTVSSSGGGFGGYGGWGGGGAQGLAGAPKVSGTKGR
jgi:hypothetical protein